MAHSINKTFKNQLMKIFFCLAMCVFVLQCSAQNKIIATITRFNNNDGVCRACLFSNAAAFEKGDAFRCTASAILNKTAQISFDNVPDGQYALFVFHDKNNNGVMDKNWLGIPKEGYGASQNKLPFAAAPAFNANRFFVSNKQVINLSMQLRNL